MFLQASMCIHVLNFLKNGDWWCVKVLMDVYLFTFADCLPFESTRKLPVCTYTHTHTH